MEPSLDVDPEQPREVVEQLAELVDPPPPGPDPWWRAGVDEALADRT